MMSLSNQSPEDLINEVFDAYKADNNLVFNYISIVNEVKPYGLKFAHLLHAVKASNIFHGGFREKKILEMGGALPSSFVHQILRADMWTAVEYSDYLDNQHHIKNTIDNKRYIYNNRGWKDFYKNWKNSDQNKFDIAYSISAFEHIYDLGGCISAIYDMLKDGGILYAYFTPIWSAKNGSHGFFPRIISPGKNHDHLQYDFITLQEVLVNSHGFSDYCAYKTAHELYKNNQINRLSYEEYIQVFKASRFENKQIAPLNMQKFEDLYTLENLEVIERLYPHMKKSCSGFEILFTKNSPIYG